MVECIGTDVKKFDMFCKYVEALVAFYKYRAVSVIADTNDTWNKINHLIIKSQSIKWKSSIGGV